MKPTSETNQYLSLLEERGLNHSDFEHLMPGFNTVHDNCDKAILVLDFCLNIDKDIVIAPGIPVDSIDEHELRLHIVEQNCNKGLIIKLLTNALNSVMPLAEGTNLPIIKWEGRYNIYDDCFIMEGYEYIAEKEGYENTYIHPVNDIGFIIDSILLNFPYFHLTKAQFSWIEAAYQSIK